MKHQSAILALLVIAMVGTVFGAEGAVPKGVPHLDHVFVIMMENHGYSQILNNPNAPFANEYARSANLATNYFAVAHPSSTNYLEIVGASNFGVHSDNNPDWHNATCTTNLASGTVNTTIRPARTFARLRERGPTRPHRHSTAQTKYRAFQGTSISTGYSRFRRPKIQPAR